MSRIKLFLPAFLLFNHGISHAHDHAEQQHVDEHKTVFTPLMIEESGIEFSVAGPGQIASEVRIYGRLVPNQDRLLHVTPRFPGVIKEVKVNIGSEVKAGDILVIVESDQSLQRYEIKTLINGTIIQKHAATGEHITESSELFEIADLSEVWGDFQAYGEEAERIEAGQQVLINLPTIDQPISGKIGYISPMVDEATQSKLIRTVLSNADGKLRPGLFISGILRAQEKKVELAVNREAIQSFEESNVVFVADGQALIPVAVELGSQDSKFAEIKSGIKPGDKYVSKNSYIIKAEIQKESASHDH